MLLLVTWHAECQTPYSKLGLDVPVFGRRYLNKGMHERINQIHSLINKFIALIS